MVSLLVLSSIVVLTIGITVFLDKKTSFSPVLSRKILHVVSIGCTAISVFLIPTTSLLYITWLSIPVLALAVYKGFFKDPQSGRKSWGIVYFAISFGLLLFFFPERKSILYYSMMILALADGFAAITGYYLGNAKSKEQKTLVGSITFFIICLLVLLISPFFIEGLTSCTLTEAILFAFLLSVIEYVSSKGLDNLTIPLAVWYWMYTEFLFMDYAPLVIIILSLLSVIAYVMKWLSIDGACMAFIFGAVYLISPYPEAILPAIIFFVVGSILSKLPGSVYEKGDKRNSIQVLANGGFSLLAIVVFFLSDQRPWLLASIVGFAVAISDTSSSEIGTRYASKSFDILGLRKLKIGASGGVSIQGLISGLFASIAIVVLTSLMINLDFKEMIVISIFGFLGNIFDSLLGSVLQVKYRVSDGSWADIDVLDSSKYAGIKWFSNDLTNLVSNTVISIISVIFFTI